MHVPQGCWDGVWWWLSPPGWQHHCRSGLEAVSWPERASLPPSSRNLAHPGVQAYQGFVGEECQHTWEGEVPDAVSPEPAPAAMWCAGPAGGEPGRWQPQIVAQIAGWGVWVPLRICTHPGMSHTPRQRSLRPAPCLGASSISFQPSQV